jgi:predicted enzyme related to lactoylglutathione lyase
MPERDGYIPGVPCWADTVQPDPDAAAAFYGDLFGWEMENVMDPGDEARYYIGRIRGLDAAAVGSIPQGAPPMAMWNTYIWVDSADDTAAKAKDAGGSVLTDPFDVGDSGRMAVLADPEGAAFCVWQANEHKGARVVNEHGSVNFNTLHTRDPKAAKEFYGSLFGWGTLNVGAEMWTLPGYGDHLEELTPGIKQQTIEVGGPEGFWDVVAAINEIADDQPDTPAHWSVTFAVDDADAIAAKATELGGKVIAPPMDLPWVRTTVLADPAGATFIASKFVPENKDLAPAGSAEAS